MSDRDARPDPPRSALLPRLLLGLAAIAVVAILGFIVLDSGFATDEIDMPLTFEATRAAGSTLGSGVVMLFDDQVDLVDILRRIAAFFRDESCGQCVPCRVGTVRQEEALHRILAGKPIGGLATERALLEEVGLAMKDASICGLGQTAYGAVETAIKRLRLFDGAAASWPR